ncbi:CotH kinase family protein [Ruminococcus difficilis]|uniref:CotH kinase family protein n=1 Tax=Ruminococcus difficilis TaxID=2763069 RepID=A0A935C7B9_9FIRM|nr:CotH kinase family protein [Ruminococcus difficilis]MBK6090033.1 CotH kinase family protein [Ruminococcus difficilis]
MKKALALLLTILLVAGALPFMSAAAAEGKGTPAAFAADKALYVHAVSDSTDAEAWQAWQSVHDEDFNVEKPNEKYFFLPSSAASDTIDVYNGYDQTVTVNGVTIASHTTEAIPYAADTAYTVTADGSSYTLKMMNSNAEAAVYINNPDADGAGTDLMTYLNADKANSAKATGAIVTPDGAIDNTTVKKIKGRGNTSWDKPKKGYNITYDKKVGIAGMEKNKKYSILPNYQDDSLSRNRILYDLSDAVGMPYASDSRYVDFYVNGYYWGSYLMCEKVEPGSLVPEVSDDGYLNEDGTIKEDFPFIAEVDASAGDDDYWVSASNLKITIKSPEIDPGQPGYDEVKEYVKTKFTAFYNATSTTGNLAAVADVESVAKLYLINELGKNWDSGVSSTFFTYKQDENGVYKFYGSPVWDYDNSLGNAVGVSWDLRTIGVTDYEEYTGWWCQHKGKSSASSKRSSNIIARISRNQQIAAIVPQIWFEDFVPALEHFSGEKIDQTIGSELYTKNEYFTMIEDSAEMNYKSGWLLNTGSWIADHSTLKKATYDKDTQKMIVSSTATRYGQNFTDMYNYAADWMLSRAAWLSEQYAPDYTPSNLLGDANLDGEVDIIDATWIMRNDVGIITFSDEEKNVADVDRDGEADVIDATWIMRWSINIETPYAIGKPIR